MPVVFVVCAKVLNKDPASDLAVGSANLVTGIDEPVAESLTEPQPFLSSQSEANPAGCDGRAVESGFGRNWKGSRIPHSADGCDHLDGRKVYG